MSTESKITLSDFRPGIFGDYHGGVAETSRGGIPVNGAATIEGTYRCCADQSGALVPLPRGVKGASPDSTNATVQQLMPAGNVNGTAAFYGPTAKAANHLIDACLHESSTALMGVSPSHEFYCMYEYWYDTTGASAAAPAGDYGRYVVGRRYQPSPVTYNDFLFDFLRSTNLFGPQNAYDSPGSVGVLSAAGAAPITTNNLWPVTFSTYNLYSWGATRPRASAAILAAQQPLTDYDTNISANYPSGLAPVFPIPSPSGFVSLTPDPNSAAAGNQWTFNKAGLPLYPIMAITHQSRLVMISDGNGLANGYPTNSSVADNVCYTAPNDPREWVGGSLVSFKTVFGEENPAGVGTMASITGTEMFMVRHTGGGYIIQGDLDYPTVVKLPYVESTYGVRSHAVTTPIGVVYGTRNGVYAWNGGDTSLELSEQIEGFFWKFANQTNYPIYRDTSGGRFEWFTPWVCVPNNYLYDTRTKAWWRLDRPADAASGIAFSVYRTSSTTGKMYAFPYLLTPTQNSPWVEYDPAALADSYSWRSQPLVETRERRRSFQEVTLTASSGAQSAAQTVNVILTGTLEDGTAVGPVTTTFTWTPVNTTGAPVVFRKTISTPFSAMFVQVQITASAAYDIPTDTHYAAPKIISVDLGVRDSTELVKS